MSGERAGVRAGPSLPELGRSLRFVIDGQAVPAGSKTAGVSKNGRRYMRDSSGNRGKAWRRDVTFAAAFACEDAGWPLSPAPFAYPMALHLTVLVEVPRARKPAAGLELWPLKPPDVVKLARAIEDALTGHLWTDDAQIVSEYLGKRYGPAHRVVVTVSELLEVPA